MKIAVGLKIFFACSLTLGMLPSLARGQALTEKTFRLAAEAEVFVDLTAAAPGTSWRENGSEAAVVTLFVDGRYHQDVILFNGSQAFTYSLLLGRLGSGDHSLRVEFNRKRSAPRASTVNIQSVEISTVDRSKDEYQPMAHAPILYARRNTIGKFSDIPLLIWYETQREGPLLIIRYSVIFTNEDGGTETNALMARWGRATDIEWVYQVKLDSQGKVVEETLQGTRHRIQRFHGKKEGDHPLILVASDNNNFSDKGRSEMRFALRPIPFDLSQHSREELMDRYPWTYRIMAEELYREGKIAEPNQIGHHIADPRHYLYLDAASDQRSTALSFAVKFKGDQRWYTSDLGIESFKIDRSGYFRTTIKVPSGTRLEDIERMVVRCDFAADVRSREALNKLSSAGCDLKSVNKVFLLGEDFQPEPSLPVSVQSLRLRSGDMVELYDGQANRVKTQDSRPRTR